MYSSAQLLGQYAELGTDPTECFEGYWLDPTATILEYHGIEPYAGPRILADGTGLKVVGLLYDPAGAYRWLVLKMPSAAADLYRELRAKGGPRGAGYGFVESCGQPFLADSEPPALLAESIQPKVPPEARPPETITVTGQLTRYFPPGIAKAWPMVDGYVLSSSIRWHTDAAYELNKLWNDGSLTAGTVLEIEGYPTESEPPKLVPLVWRILKAGPKPSESPKDPLDIDFPESPKDVPGPRVPTDAAAPNGNGARILAGLGAPTGLLLAGLFFAFLVGGGKQ